LFFAPNLGEEVLMADILHVDLPELQGTYGPYTVKTAAFDLGIQLESVNNVKMHWSGSITPGVACGDGVLLPPDSCFPLGAQMAATMDPDEPGMWHVFTGPYNGEFEETAQFERYLNETWQFLLDGAAEVDASLEPNIVIGGIMVIPPVGVIYEAELIIDAVPAPICGDADASGAVDIDDVVYLVDYIFSEGPPPDPFETGDVNCSGDIDVDDVVFLIAYIFSDGNAPCDIDGDGEPDC
jgi:hypothetical protein